MVTTLKNLKTIDRATPAVPVRRGLSVTAVRRIVFFVGLLALWELVARLGFWPSYLFPGPLEVSSALASGIRKGHYLQGMWVSTQRIIIGYSLSLVLGVVMGALIARNKILEDTVGALVSGLQALPSVCWLPLAILWFGLNDRAIIFVVVMGALFSIILGVESGIRNTPPIYVKAARNLGARGIALYWQVIFPSALPSIVSGLKQGWSFAWRSLMAGELLYYTLSLGNLLQTGRDLNDAAQVMAVMVLIVVLGVSVNQLIFAPIERRISERWGFGVVSQ